MTLKKKTALFLSFLNQGQYLLYFFFIGIFFVIYALALNQIKSYAETKENNFNSFLESNEFSNIKESIFEKSYKTSYFSYMHYKTFIYKNKESFSTQSSE